MQGDVVKIIDRLGNTKVTYTYGAWGKVLSQTDTSIYNLANLNPFRYRGYVYDYQTGLYYLQSRYYDPITGRFLNADAYVDTANSVLSTNMFAYCENNAVIKYDVTGEDAWWIQSPNSVPLLWGLFGKAGHTSLLVQEKAGFWWYFYWGDKSIQMLFLGTTTQKDIGNKVKRFLNAYKRIMGSNIVNLSYDENYTKSIRLSGDFYPTYKYIMNLLKIHASKNGGKLGLRFNPNCKENINKSDLNKDYHKYYKYKNKKFDQPLSWIIIGNAEYNVFGKNCMDMSVISLSKGSLNKYNKYFSSRVNNLSNNYTIPNDAYNKMISYKYGTEYKI